MNKLDEKFILKQVASFDIGCSLSGSNDNNKLAAEFIWLQPSKTSNPMLAQLSICFSSSLFHCLIPARAAADVFEVCFYFCFGLDLDLANAGELLLHQSVSTIPRVATTAMWG